MRVIAIGDVHGCFYTLRNLLEMIKPVQGDTVIFLGDYIDRGPHSKMVVDLIMQLEESREVKYIALMGNHEDMCVDYHRPNDGFGDSFMMNGGAETIESFGGSISDLYLDWMASLPTVFETDSFYFCHAGFRPEVPPEKQTRMDKLWIRDDFIDSNYWWAKPVVHGHTPSRSIEVSRARIGVDTGGVFGQAHGGRYGLLSAVDTVSGAICQVKKSDQDIAKR